MYELSLEHFVVPESKKIIEDYQDLVKRTQNLSCVSSLQVYINKDINCSQLKHIKYVEIPEFIIILQK